MKMRMRMLRLTWIGGIWHRINVVAADIAEQHEPGAAANLMTAESTIIINTIRSDSFRVCRFWRRIFLLHSCSTPPTFALLAACVS